MSLRLVPRLAVSIALIAWVASTFGAAAEDFYRGKTINFIIGYGPGGGVDSASRVIVRHLPRFIPGKPDIVGQNMEGAGGVVSGNFLGTKASRDGLTIGLPGRSWFVEGIVKTQGVTFDPSKLNYIGSTGTNNTLLWVHGNLKINTLEELRKHPEKIPTAGIGPGTPTVTVPNMLIGYGYPLRSVLGYNSSARVLLALAENAGDTLERALTVAGARCTRFDVYRTIPAPKAAERRAMSTLGADNVIFASPTAVHGFVQQVAVDVPIKVFSIGPSTSAAVRAAGLHVTAEAREPNLDGILECMQWQT